MAAAGGTPQGFGAHWLLRLRLGEPGEVFTFYSYKGGTGRSMSLVNCAGLIAQHLPSGAKPLLLIDFDLEAPGLHRYLAPCLPMPPEAPAGGVLELFGALSQQVDAALQGSGAGALDDEAVVQLLAGVDLAPYILPVVLPGASADDPTTLHLMPAGRFGADYDERLASFNWIALFAKAPALFRAFSDRLSALYSFVFIDSRTGLSDTSGICTMLLPDALVMVFTPNNQSLTGIEHLVRKAVAYRETASDGRPLRVYPMASRVDNQVEHFRRVWRLGDASHPLFGAVTGYQPLFQALFDQTTAVGEAELASGLGEYFDQVQVPHAADYAFGERLCFGPQSSSDSLSIRGAYELFLPWLVTGAQPWQRPADSLLHLQAGLWLKESGAAEEPDADSGWPAWFDRLARVTASSESRSLPFRGLAAERRFDIALAQSLAQAHVGDYAAARSALDLAASAYDDDTAPSLLRRGPIELLRLWQHDPPWPKPKPDLAAWLEAMDRLMARWQSLKADRRAWLAALLPVARAGALHELVWRATAGLEGDGSDAAIDALLAQAEARKGVGDLTGALRLLEDGQKRAVVWGGPESGRMSATAWLRLRTALGQLATVVQRRTLRPLPAYSDCEFTAYVSFTTDDSLRWPNWVEQFTGELDRGLRTSMRGVRLRSMYSSGEARAEQGSVVEDLIGRVTKAFALIVVAGDNWVYSTWCQRELQAFLTAYGAAAMERIQIVALTQWAAEQVRAWSGWQAAGAEAPVCLPFFDADQPDRPVEVYTNPGLVAKAFLEPFLRLRSNLAESLQASVLTTPKSSADLPLPSTNTPLTPAPLTASIYIESNRHERDAWESLGEALQRRWATVVNKSDSAPVRLRVRGLPFDRASDMPVLDDAVGVLLLWGRKEASSLLAQVDQVEARMSGQRPCPGLIAHLSPPRPAAHEPFPAHGWRVLRFVASSDDEFDVVSDDAPGLDRYLRQVLAFATARASGDPA